MWSALIAGNFRAWRERRQVLRELGDLQEREGWALARDQDNPVNRAKVTLIAGDPVAARQHWAEALARFPRFARESPDAVEILLGLRNFDEAEALSSERMRRKPRDPLCASDHALVAERRGDTEEAIRRWQQVRTKFPDHWMGYVREGVCLRTVGQPQAAEDIHAEAVTLFPDELFAALEWARTAEHRRDWPEAIRRWEQVCGKFHNPHGDLGVARGLEELGRMDEAETRLKGVQGGSSLGPEIAIALARLAERRGDKETALQRWTDIIRLYPTMQAGYKNGFRLLLEQDRRADAAAILLAAIKRFPAEAWPAVEYALLASTQKEWAEAATRWAAVRAGWPDRPDGYLRAAEALAALGRQEDAAQVRAEHQSRVDQQAEQ